VHVGHVLRGWRSHHDAAAVAHLGVEAPFHGEARAQQADGPETLILRVVAGGLDDAEEGDGGHGTQPIEDDMGHIGGQPVDIRPGPGQPVDLLQQVLGPFRLRVPAEGPAG
jgi:hypothetical protein